MRILQVCKKFPYPIKDGEVIAITNLARAYHQLGATVDLVCINTPKHFFDKKDLPKDFDFYTEIESVFVDTNVKITGAFANLFSKKSYHIDRFVSEAFRTALIKILEKTKPDIVQLETLFLAPYVKTIRQHSDAKIVMRAHNVEHEIWDRIVQNTNSFLKKNYLAHLTKKLKRFEVAHLNQYDLLLPITSRDLDYFKKLGFNGASHVVPIGINHSDYQPDFSSYQKPLSVSFIGSLDWMPNIEGLEWFIEKVWSTLHQQYPHLRLELAGRNTPDKMYQLEDKNIKVVGEVSDAKDFINQHSVMIVPLLSGSGMRVKILEGMALGRVVITTTIGLEGIHAEHQKQVLIADTPAAFIDAFDFCQKHPERLQEIGKKAASFIKAYYDNLEIAKRVLNEYRISST